MKEKHKKVTNLYVYVQTHTKIFKDLQISERLNIKFNTVLNIFEKRILRDCYT